MVLLILIGANLINGEGANVFPVINFVVLHPEEMVFGFTF